ncbi:MAG TPA: hypothetical protein VHY20_13295, partial [Pirellulales bacterium]|nr:hypothetical protein [Pirellulales bacterium]
MLTDSDRVRRHMMHRWIIAYSLAALLLSAGGCAGRGKAQPLAATGATQPPAAAEAGKPAADAAAANANRDADMIRMMGELQALGALDPKALDQLLKDLQQTDPALWPQVMQVFRASLAYRQRTLAKQSAGDADQVAAAASAAAETSALLAAPAGTPTSAGDGRQPAPLDGSLPVAAQPISAGAPTAPAVAGGLGAKGPAAAITSVAASGAKTDGLPAVRQVSYEQPIAEDHQQLLTKTIQALESSAGGNDPAAAQAARQVYLRMLYLAAGRRDDALRPIVGLPPNEQEFWSEQLFGL